MCYKKLYVNKLDNLDEMVKFLERLKLPKMTQKKIEILPKPTTKRD